MTSSMQCKHGSEPILTDDGVFFNCSLSLFGGKPNWTQCSGCTSYEGESRGLGDTIAKATKKMGIKPCKPCQKRRQKLNKAIPYAPKNNKPKTPPE